MSITLTANYRDTLQPETLKKIDELVEDRFDLSPILEFIDEHSEEDFREYYEEYVSCGEEYGYEEVDAYLTLHELDELRRFEDLFVGVFYSPAEMAEEFLSSDYDRMHYAFVIDWDATATNLLDDGIDQVGHVYFRSY